MTIPFTGKAGESYRFFSKPAPKPGAATGRWAVTEPDGDAIRRGVGEFRIDIPGLPTVVRENPDRRALVDPMGRRV